MSYTILYDKVFIKTPNGITVVALSGDNNVWETNRRRARDWSCWALDKPEAELRAYFKSLHNSYDQHFKVGGKFLTNDGLDRWIENGIKNAKTIEEILEFNPYRSLNCKLLIYNNKIPYGETGYCLSELDSYIHDTNEFIKWIRKAKTRRESKTVDEEIYCVTSFGIEEPIRHPRVTNKTGKIIVKYKKMYVSKCNNGQWKEAAGDISKALIFDNIEDAKEHVNPVPHITYVDADAALKRKEDQNYIIAAYRNGLNLGYVHSVSKSGFHHTAYIDGARRYTEADAKRNIKNLENRFPSCYKFVIEQKIKKGE